MNLNAIGLWMKLSEDKFGPMLLTSAKVSILDLVAEVQIEQSYFNEENHAIEAIYRFPLTGSMYI